MLVRSRLATALAVATGLSLLAVTVPGRAGGTVGPRAAVPLQVRGPAGRCTGVAFSVFQIVPAVVDEGATATLQMAIRNCTSKPFRGEATTSGVLVCLVLDPLASEVQVDANAVVRRTEPLRAPPCTGTGHLNGNLANSSGTTLSQRTATLQVDAPSP